MTEKQRTQLRNTLIDAIHAAINTAYDALDADATAASHAPNEEHAVLLNTVHHFNRQTNLRIDEAMKRLDALENRLNKTTKEIDDVHDRITESHNNINTRLCPLESKMRLFPATMVKPEDNF